MLSTYSYSFPHSLDFIHYFILGKRGTRHSKRARTQGLVANPPPEELSIDLDVHPDESGSEDEPLMRLEECLKIVHQTRAKIGLSGLTHEEIRKLNEHSMDLPQDPQFTIKLYKATKISLDLSIISLSGTP